MRLPDRLKHLQELMAAGDPRALDVYSTLGVYMGYALGHLASVYDFRHALLVGRVTSGHGGKVMVDRARHVLRADFPDLAAEIVMPGEKSRRHGQAIVAASLPPSG